MFVFTSCALLIIEAFIGRTFSFFFLSFFNWGIELNDNDVFPILFGKHGPGGDRVLSKEHGCNL